MKPGLLARPALAGLLLCSGVAFASGTVPSLIAVDAIEPGQWQVTEVGSNAPARSLCVADPVQLLHIEHGQAHCTHLTLSDLPRAGTISYSCAGSGNGRTTLKLVSSNDFRLETQGILEGAPFDKAYQAHRLGSCAGTPR